MYGLSINFCCCSIIKTPPIFDRYIVPNIDGIIYFFSALHDHYRGIFSEDAADRSFQRHQDVSVYIFKDAGDPNDRSICDPAVSFRSCSLGDHGINVWNAKWKHGSDDGNRLWIRQFHLQQRNCVDNFIIDHYITNCGILDLRK